MSYFVKRSVDAIELGLRVYQYLFYNCWNTAWSNCTALLSTLMSQFVYVISGFGIGTQDITVITISLLKYCVNSFFETVNNIIHVLSFLIALLFNRVCEIVAMALLILQSVVLRRENSSDRKSVV